MLMSARNETLGHEIQEEAQPIIADEPQADGGRTGYCQIAAAVALADERTTH